MSNEVKLTATGGQEAKSVSDAIRERIERAGDSYFSNDNISQHIRANELPLLVDELADKFTDVLKSLVIDVERDPNSMDTGRRLAKMYVHELFDGRYSPEPNATAFPNEDESRYEGMLVVRSELKSVCSHHHQPVSGVAYIGIIPGKKVIGLSKYTRIAQWHARRGTLQEELCQRIQKSIARITETDNVAVYIIASHGCCENRGIMAKDSKTQTTVLGGDFKRSDLKQEFFDNIKMQSYRCD